MPQRSKRTPSGNTRRCPLAEITALPDSAGRLSNHRRARFAGESLREISRVRYHAVDAEPPGGVLVGQRLQARDFRRLVLAPDLRKAKEESLIGRVTID